MTAAPLPGNLYNADTQEEWHKAFESCKRLEQNDTWVQQPGLNDSNRRSNCVVAARTLGYALRFALSDEGRDYVARSVNSCYDDTNALVELAHLFITGMVRVCRCLFVLPPLSMLIVQASSEPERPYA